MAKIHPTAVVHPSAVLADDVDIGAYSVVEADVTIGPGTVLREHATLRRYTTIGQNNMVDSHAVLGGLPQDLKFDPRTVSYLRVGDHNVFREGVTISRAMSAAQAEYRRRGVALSTPLTREKGFTNSGLSFIYLRGLQRRGGATGPSGDPPLRRVGKVHEARPGLPIKDERR